MIRLGVRAAFVLLCIAGLARLAITARPSGPRVVTMHMSPAP